MQNVLLCLYSPNTCKDVFNPNITTFQSNCVEGLHFSAFHLKHEKCEQSNNSLEIMIYSNITSKLAIDYIAIIKI